MEKCAKLSIADNGQIQQILQEISCEPIIYTEYPNWFIWGGIVAGLVVICLVLVRLLWNVWASKKEGEADLQQAHREQQIQVSQAQGRLDAAKLNKEAAIVEAEAASGQIKRIGKQTTQ